MKIYVINGANLNLLGTREPEIYGSKTLSDINAEITNKCRTLNVPTECVFFQSNHEGEIIDKLHEAARNADGVILNPGAFTHYSYAIRDAISAIGIPVTEVHLSNIHTREEFRHKSVVSAVCKGVICGFGSAGYLMALEVMVNNN
ncbi:MAG: type II 3-dehydroquinate dehydratase [Oscillospiraceae bacterium]|nr:type II 3-dehydroquinate dehydratase [Oscillospiraceae bacterium]